DPLSAQAQGVPTVLTGHLQADELTCSATLHATGKSIMLSATNNANRPLVLDGNSARISQPGADAQPLTLNQIISPPPRTDLPGDIISVTSSVGTLGAVPIAVGTREKLQTKSVAFYGKDDKRRKLAERLFGKRILFPGESTKAELFLSKSANLGQSVSIPVTSHPDGASLGTLELAGAGG